MANDDSNGDKDSFFIEFSQASTSTFFITSPCSLRKGEDVFQPFIMCYVRSVLPFRQGVFSAAFLGNLIVSTGKVF